MDAQEFLAASAGERLWTDAEMRAYRLELDLPVSSDEDGPQVADVESASDSPVELEELNGKVPLTEEALKALQEDLGPASASVHSPAASTAPSVTTSVATSGLGGKRQRVCVNEGCVFSMSKPGQACSVHTWGASCMWRDPAKLEKALSHAQGIQQVNRALNCFQRLGSPALAQAQAKLPGTFQRKQKYCLASGCCFSRAKPGKAAQVDAQVATCGFCTFGEDGVLVAEGNAGDLQNLRASLAMFARNSPETLEKAWPRLSASFKEGCEHYVDYCRQHRAERKTLYRERQAMLAWDPLLQRERMAMGQEDYLRLDGVIWSSYPFRAKPGAKTACRRGLWFLQKPPPLCCHPTGRDGPEWTCPINAANVPACPAFECRICKSGYRARDPKPDWGKYWPEMGLFAETDSDEWRAALRAYSRDLVMWEAAQPPALPCCADPRSPMAKAVEQALKRPRTEASRREEARGLFSDDESPAIEVHPEDTGAGGSPGEAEESLIASLLHVENEDDVLQEDPALLDESSSEL